VPDIVAVVNSTTITREELAQECRVHYGKEVLEAMVNKYLILQECRRRGITVTPREVNEEIEQMAKSFNLPVDQWLKLLKQERNIKPEQYANDIIWPSLALRKLAGDRLAVTQDELIRAFETEYGASVNVRLIVCSTVEKAQKVRAKAAADPAEFGNLAKNYSEDAPSASMKGIVQPIRKHGASREIEEAAFGLSDGQVSAVLHANGQYVILKRARLNQARPTKLEEVAPRLEKVIRDRKMRTVAADIFKQLQEDAAAHQGIKNVYNDPILSRQMPQGVVALVNDSAITMRQLDDECIDRHGIEVLEGTINHKLLEQACHRQNIVVSEKDLDDEIARAASLMVRTLPDGSPDVKAWVELVTKRQGISAEVYRHDAVWPSVALRKLVGDKVSITEDDLRKGFEANFGPRVRCRAIVMNNQRRAQQVWEMARQNLSLEHFSELATKYSIEASSRALAGEVPPIRKYGGQPLLEDEAFSLKPGEFPA
jgi:parvulin-like peptidyl-prolyl isomerase